MRILCLARVFLEWIITFVLSFSLMKRCCYGNSYQFSLVIIVNV